MFDFQWKQDILYNMTETYRRCVHFVGFRGEEYHSAVKVWGVPDFFHLVWDYRARAEIAEGDTAVFAKYDPAAPPSEFSYDDSAHYAGETNT